MFFWTLVSPLLGVLLWLSPAGAQEPARPIVEVTYEQALSLARERSPRIRAAQARARGTQSLVDAAGVWNANPQISAAAGPRYGSDEQTFDWAVEVQQWLEMGGQRGDRLRAARAGVELGEAQLGDVQRLHIRDVSLAFVAVLHWAQRTTLAQEQLHIAEATARVAARRHEVGDAGGLEAAVSALAVVRARSGVDRTQAAFMQATGRLKALLGVDAAAKLVCRGDIRGLVFPHTPPTQLSDRPDLKALRAGIRQAEAEAALGRAGRVPNIAIGAGFAREESADIIEGTLSLELPVFHYGQGVTAAAHARRDRLRAELEAAQSRAAVEADTAHVVAATLSAAAQRFEEGGLALVDRAERQATASYEAGAIPLGELLAVRRELVQAKLDYAEMLRGAATARIEYAASTGAFQ